MSSTSHFQDVLYAERCSVADEYYVRSAPLVFQKDESGARLEVRCLSSETLESFDKERMKQNGIENVQIIAELNPRPQVIDLKTECLDTFIQVGYINATRKLL